MSVDFCDIWSVWSQVFRGLPSLLRDLEGLFADSWARPGVDLQPEMTPLGSQALKSTKAIEE